MIGNLTLEPILLLVLIIYSLIVAIIAGKNKTSESKILIYVSIASIFLYSGYGIAYKEVNNAFAIQYCVFLAVYAIAISIGINLATKWKIKRHFVLKIQNKPNEEEIYITKNGITISVIVFFVTLLVPLIYPTFRLLDIFKLPSLNMGDIYAKINTSKSDPITKLASTLQTFLLPFFMIGLYKYTSTKKKTVTILLVLAWIYLDYLQFTYLGRYDLVVYMVFLLIYALMFDGKQVVIQKKKMLIICIIGFFIILPLLNMLVYVREGWNYDNNGFLENIKNLVETESYYPIYYDTCIKAYDASDIPVFFGWLLTLPIPSIIWPGKPDVTVAHKFTYILTGRIFGQQYYSSVLPSVLGEGFMIFGPNNYWISAAVTGLLCGIVLGYLSKHKEARLFVVYLALLSAKMGRAGVVSYLPNVINGALSLLVYMMITNGRKKFDNANNQID